MGRLVRADTIDPRKLNWVTQVTVSRDEIDNLPFHRLGRGERAVIAYGYAHSSCLVGLDDRQARLFAEKLKLNVVGTVGVILKAKRAGIIPVVKPLLDELPRQGFRFSSDLYVEILRLANEEKG